MRIKSKMTKKTLKNIEKITGTKLTLGKLLWAIREADDISQVEFSDTLKMSRQHLCDIEHGRKSVSPKLAAKYADILGYSKEQFIRLALQDLLDRDGLNVQVEITLTKGQRKHDDSRVTA
jgi:transcriptional regulator with XRE-family HTH domain